MLKKLSLAVCLAGLVASPAFADDTIDVSFRGQISDNACMFSINGKDNQTINLGTIPAVANALGLMQTLTFKVDNCGTTYAGASVTVANSNGAFDTTGRGKLIPSNFDSQTTNTARIAFYKDVDGSSGNEWILDGVNTVLDFSPTIKEEARYVRLEAGTTPEETLVEGMVQFLITYDDPVTP